jgi:hypothetical protein
MNGRLGRRQKKNPMPPVTALYSALPVSAM